MPARDAPPQVVIEPWTDRDLELLRALNAPEMMRHVGGPETDDQVLRRHHGYLGSGTPRDRMFRIVLLPRRVAVGNIGYWERQWKGRTVYETGWNVLPAYQGRGICTVAATAAVARARQDRRHRFLHAFPAVMNAASNAVCRKVGFALIGACDFEYPPGTVMRCNDWCLDLGVPD